MARVYIALGSNEGRRWRELGRAVESLRELDADLAVSPVYETAPVGGPAGQGPFLNAVVTFVTARSPHELLSYAQALEHHAGRVRNERWGPRPLDVDILLIEGVALHTVDLVIPHPRMNERAFVLAPLFDLAPDLVGEAWCERFGGEEVVQQSVRRVGAIVSSEPYLAEAN